MISQIGGPQAQIGITLLPMSASGLRDGRVFWLPWPRRKSLQGAQSQPVSYSWKSPSRREALQKAQPIKQSEGRIVLPFGPHIMIKTPES